MTCMGADDKNTVNFLCEIVLVYQAWYIGTMYRLEEGMKVSEFVKRVIIPIVSALFLAAMFRPLCTENGECDYLKQWLLSRIPFGIQRMSLWVIPKGYDIGSSMGVLALNLLVGSVIDGIMLTWRLLMAIIYLAKMVLLGIDWIMRKVAGKPCGVV